MKKWGLSNVHQETWNTPAGIGWENERFSLQGHVAQSIHRACGSAGMVGRHERHRDGARDEVQAGCFDELKQKYAGKLKNAFLMTTPPRNAGERVHRHGEPQRRFDARRMEAAQPDPAVAAAVAGPGRRTGRALRRLRAQAARDSAAPRRGRRWPRRWSRRGRGGFKVADTTTLALAAAAGSCGDPARRAATSAVTSARTTVRRGSRAHRSVPYVHVAPGIVRPYRADGRARRCR